MLYNKMGKGELMATELNKTEAIRTLDEIGYSTDKHLKQGAEEWIAAGQDLIEARNHPEMKHGSWLPWLENRNLAIRSADNLMRVAKEAIEANWPRAANMANLGRRTLELLAAPSTPEPVRQEVLEQSKDKKITRKDVEKLIQEAKEKAKEEVLQEVASTRFTEEQLKEQIAKAEDTIKAEAGAKLRERDRKIQAKEEEERKRADYISKLELNIHDLKRENSDFRRGKDIPNFRTRLSTMNTSISELIQNDTLVKLLIELEGVKEILEFDHDIEGIELLINELNQLSNRALKWIERITPTSDRWVYLQQQKGK